MEDEYIEVTEKTLEDAITTACQELSVTSDRLDYIVVSNGSAGLFGIGAKPAVIKARIREISLEEYKKQPATKEFARPEKPQNTVKKAGKAFDEKGVSGADRAAEEQKPRTDFAGTADDTSSSGGTDFAGAASGSTEDTSFEVKSAVDDFLHSSSTTTYGDEDRSRERRGGRNGSRYGRSRRYERGEVQTGDYNAPVSVPHEEKEPLPEEKQLSDEKIAGVEAKAETFLKDVFAAMGITVTISQSFEKEWNTLNIDLAGDDMGVLIGKRGQTLDSIQYLVSLVINRGEEGYIHVKADTENYRARRKETLENLARGVAAKVKRTHRPVALEPMNPYERRIIHSALQGDRYVTTHSEGDEPYRKVVVTPKNN